MYPSTPQAPFQPQEPHSSHVKLVIISITSLLVVIGLTLVILFVIHGALKKKDAVVAPQQTATAATLTNGLQATLTNSSYVVSPLGKDSQQSILVASGNLYVTMPTSSGLSVRMVAGKSFSNNEAQSVENAVSQYLTKQGLTVTATTINNVAVEAASNTVTCNISVTKDGDAISSLFIPCIDVSDANGQLKAVAAQFTSWPDQPKNVSHFIVQPRSLTEGKYTAAVDYVTMDQSTQPHQLVFINDGATWTYIGDAAQGTAVEQNEQYIINADIKKGLDNAQYGSVLKKLLTS